MCSRPLGYGSIEHAEYLGRAGSSRTRYASAAAHARCAACSTSWGAKSAFMRVRCGVQASIDYRNAPLKARRSFRTATLSPGDEPPSRALLLGLGDEADPRQPGLLHDADQLGDAPVRHRLVSAQLHLGLRIAPGGGRNALGERRRIDRFVAPERAAVAV